MSTFALVNEATLIDAISRCRTRLVYIAPGLTEPIAIALGQVLARKAAPAVTIIVDVDPEVCRLGYGTTEGLKALRALAENYHIGVRYQAGLRVGLLISDDDLMVYAPTPLLIEAGSSREDQPNAIVLGTQPLEQVLQACAAEGETGANARLPYEAEIGTQAATPKMLDESLRDLERLPPKPYDISRIERVFNSKLQYVDFEVSGYKLSSRRRQIPNDLLVGEDKTLEQRLRNTFTLLEGKDVLQVDIPELDPKTQKPVLGVDGKPRTVKYSEKRLEEDRKKIYDDFLINVPGYGQLIMRSRRPVFDQRVDWFCKRVELFRDAVRQQLDQAIEQSVRELANALLPSMRDQMPERLMKCLTVVMPTDQDLLGVLEAELRSAFGADEEFFDPDIKVVFKDLTYETIKDKKFRDALTKVMRHSGGDAAVMRLFEEYDAAPETGHRP